MGPSTLTRFYSNDDPESPLSGRSSGIAGKPFGSEKINFEK